ncbi:hypothetical protein B2G51_11660 [Leptospira santarosai]|nr:hypothetical protein B2G51_11660 [Leptospira santarosai]
MDFMDRSFFQLRWKPLAAAFVEFNRSSWLCQEPSISLRDLRPYLALYGSLDKFDRKEELCQARFTRTTACRNFEKSPKDYL